MKTKTKLGLGVTLLTTLGMGIAGCSPLEAKVAADEVVKEQARPTVTEEYVEPTSIIKPTIEPIVEPTLEKKCQISEGSLTYDINEFSFSSEGTMIESPDDKYDFLSVDNHLYLETMARMNDILTISFIGDNCEGDIDFTYSIDFFGPGYGTDGTGHNNDQNNLQGKATFDPATGLYSTTLPVQIATTTLDILGKTIVLYGDDMDLPEMDIKLFEIGSFIYEPAYGDPETRSYIVFSKPPLEGGSYNVKIDDEFQSWCFSAIYDSESGEKPIILDSPRRMTILEKLNLSDFKAPEGLEEDINSMVCFPLHYIDPAREDGWTINLKHTLYQLSERSFPVSEYHVNPTSAVFD